MADGEAERRSRRPLLLLGALLAPLAFVGLLFLQILLALRGERVPNPEYTVDVRVTPEGDAAGVGGDGAVLRLVALGDSTVAGVGAPTMEDSLAVQVARRVADQLGRPVDVLGYGVSGARTDDVLRDQVPAVDGTQPDVVLVVVGANDVTHATPPWQLRSDLAVLADALTERTDAPVVLGGVPRFDEATVLAQPLRALVDGYALLLRPFQRSAAEDAGMAYVEIARDASPRFRRR
jgi:lysophospholipase L1-like esterase